MTAAPATSPLPATPLRARTTEATGLLDALLLWVVALTPITKLYIEPLGRLVLSNALAGVFIVAFVVARLLRTGADREPLTRACQVLLVAATVFTCVYLAGYVAMDEGRERVQFAKAFAVWLVHGGFMVCAALHLSGRGLPLLQRAVQWLLAGFAASAVWALLQLVALRAGADIDASLISKLPFSPGNLGSIQYYGGGLYRATGLTLDANHLGVMMCVPIALSLTWLQGRLRWCAAALFTLALIFTLSRSGVLAAVAAVGLLAWHSRRRLLTRRAVTALIGAGVLAVVGAGLFVELRPDLAESVIRGRLNVQGQGAQAHVRLYTLIPGMLADSPVFGNGMNSFALLFEQTSGGREGFGAHSHYIRTLVETGWAGFVVFGAFAAWLLARLHLIGDTRAAGLAAAIVGTLVGNLFYLTTQILYVDTLYALAVAAPVGMGIRYHRTTMTSPTAAPPSEARTYEEVSSTARDPEATLAERLSPLGRLWWLIALGAVLGLVVGVVARGGDGTRYQASATVYLGQPVGQNGALLETISSKAATGIQLATGEEAVKKAAKAADVSSARIRRGLTVAAVSSPLASKLASPPSIMKVTVRDSDRGVAQAATVAISEHLLEESGEYAQQKMKDVESEIDSLEGVLASLTKQRSGALSSTAGTRDDEILVTVLNSSIASTRVQLADARTQLTIARELEQSRIIDAPSASKVSTAERGSSLVVAALVGAIVGALIAFALGRRPAR